jgi:hypothetical protein
MAVNFIQRFSQCSAYGSDEKQKSTNNEQSTQEKKEKKENE